VKEDNPPFSINEDLVAEAPNQTQEDKPKVWMFMVAAFLDLMENVLKQISLTMLS
jgi:sulfur transfer complex TusBCD TusB component (DsrH family)